MRTKIAQQELQMAAERDDGFSDRRHGHVGSHGGEMEFNSVQANHLNDVIRQLEVDPRKA